MTPEEALKITSALCSLNVNGLTPSEIAAIKLEEEALKRCRTLAQNSPLWAAKPLPGETKD